MSIWFGRSRVQERVGDTDERNVTERPSARMDEPPATGGTPAPRDDRATDVDKGPAIDALRAATNAAGSDAPRPNAPSFNASSNSPFDAPVPNTPNTNAPVPSPDAVSEIGRLHEMTLAAERRAKRLLGTPGARRKLQNARVAEAMSLQMHGFASYEAFAAIYEPERLAASLGDDSEMGSEETIARIRVLLTELGVDPLDDPLQAASVFLTAHEGEIPAPSAARCRTAGSGTAGRRDSVAEPALAEPLVAEPLVAEPLVAEVPVVEPVVAEVPVAEPAVAEPLVAEPAEAPMADHVVEHLDIAEVVANIGPAPTPAPELPAPERPISDLPRELPAIAAAAQQQQQPRRRSASPRSRRWRPGFTEDLDEIRLEPDLPPTPVAEIPGSPEIPVAAEAPGPAEIWAEPPLAKPADDEVVDRWIHAEARAERMHAEVDRAQAELMAMLAALGRPRGVRHDTR